MSSALLHAHYENGKADNCPEIHFGLEHSEWANAYQMGVNAADAVADQVEQAIQGVRWEPMKEVTPPRKRVRVIKLDTKAMNVVISALEDVRQQWKRAAHENHKAASDSSRSQSDRNLNAQIRAFCEDKADEAEVIIREMHKSAVEEVDE